MADVLRLRIRVIDGADSTLEAIEREPVSKKNRPIKDIVLTHVGVSGFARLLLHRVPSQSNHLIPISYPGDDTRQPHRRRCLESMNA